ncbi:Alpha/Beta hydrolase protein [Phakopsora pachyrhizi]|uniref:Alpha/Beta hydrolase protein n=1 Tax=Phakopsora pachyrhizi TaxID=170000 RepID=A0AAV0BQ20_PHAPC|nr:Alpha/Beta hydrolase protein [Phakopsora pachyrhizi]
MGYRTEGERGKIKTVLDRLPWPLGHASVPYLRLKLPFGFSDVNSAHSLFIAASSRSFSLTANLLKNQEHIGQPEFPCVQQHHSRSANLMKLRDGTHSSAWNGVHGVYNIGTSKSSAHISEGPEPAYSNTTSGYKIYHHPDQFKLDYGQSLSSFDLAYETWGILSSAKDNVILLHTGLSASSHAKSHDFNKSLGWWEKFIGHGPNYPIDLDRYFVICTNVLGSCYGSTGPSSINPETNEPYGTHFPIISIFDMVRAQFKLLDHLGISKLFASVGSSMGGMQSIVTAWLEPQRVQRVVSISGCGRTGPSSIALRYAQRSVLMSDPNWSNGFYYGKIPPHVGMKLARQIATITYRSGPEWEQRFGRQRLHVEDVNSRKDVSRPVLCPDFLIESYLDHQGEQFCLKYDANSLIYISKAMDLFDMTQEGLEELNLFRSTKSEPQGDILNSNRNENLNTLKNAQQGTNDRILSSLPNYEFQVINSLAKTFEGLDKSQKFLILGVQSDVLFPINLQRQLAESIRFSGNKNLIYYELDSPYGHDTFLIDLAGVGGGKFHFGICFSYMIRY